MIKIGESLKDFEGVSVPEVYTVYSSSRVITTAFQDPVKITNVAQIKAWKLDGGLLAERLILAYCKMILEDGFYYADPHPGNVLLREDGKIIGGGLPVGAYGASDEIMGHISPLGNVYQAGTLSGNPVTMPAGVENQCVCK